MRTAASADDRRRPAVRVLAGLFALSWFVYPGFGVQDLTVTWAPGWAEALEAGWGLFMTVLVAVPFAAVAITGRAAGVLPQLAVAAAAMVVSAVATGERLLLPLALLLAAEGALVAWPRRRALRPRIRPAVLVAAAVGLVPWCAYAFAMWEQDRQHAAGSDITLGIDHLALQGGFAVAVVASVLLAGTLAEGAARAGVGAGGAAAYLGVVSWAWFPTSGALPPPWSALAVVWGAAVVVVTVWATRPWRRMRPDAPVGGRPVGAGAGSSS